MNKTVLLLAEYGVLNGGERSCLAVVDELTAAGWMLLASVPGGTELAAEFQRRQIPVHDWAAHDQPQRKKTQGELRMQLASLIDSLQPDLIHCNSLSTSRLAGPVAAAAGVPAIGYLRDILRLSKTAVSDINQLCRIVAVSNATRQWHLQQGIDAKRCCVIYNGVDTDSFCPPALAGDAGRHRVTQIRQALGLADSDRVLLYVGQIGIRKGIDILLQAFATLASDDPQLHLLIVGERHSIKQEAVDYENALHDSLVGQPEQSRVHWLGRRSDVNCLMQMATILVHPARQEPLGRVLLEAAASGLPIVTTDVGGSSEILAQPELSPYLVPAGDPTALAAQVLRLLAAPGRQIVASEMLRSEAMTRFSIARCAAELGAIYRAALDSAARPDIRQPHP